VSAFKRQLTFIVALVAIGGSGLLLNAQLPQPVGTWADGGQISARTGSAAVTLADGRTLIVAGQSADGSATSEVLVYDPAAGTVTVAGSLTVARTEHAAVLLKDGRVLVAGGLVDGAPSADIELFDPATGTSAIGATMLEARSGLSAARLQDKSVLLVGGSSSAGLVMSSTERFDPETGSVTPSGTLGVPRKEASATTLHDGRVVVAGGSDGTSDLRSAEIYTPYAGTFTTLESELSSARRGHIALLLPNNGSLMIAGGVGNGEPLSSVDVYSPAEFPDPYSYSTSQFTTAAAMAAARVRGIAGDAALEGHIFVSGGGAAAAETYRFPTIRTDKDDYAPGQTAVITGTGWEAGEVVTLRFQEDPAVHDDYVLTVTADGEGRIFWDHWAPENHDLGVRFYLIARGEWSDRVAQTTFTDGQPRITNVSNAIISPEQPSSAGVLDTTDITAKNQGGGNLSGFEIRIRNSSGNLVRTFLIGNVNANAELTRTWNGRDGSNAVLPDGDYIASGFATGQPENTAANDTKIVTIDNTNPTATLTAPADGATVPGTFDLEVSPVDAGGNDQNIQRVDFYIDGNLAGSDSNNSSGWRFSASPDDGAHTWFVRVFDKAGNNVQSSTRSFTVDSVRPSVTITQAVGQADPTGASPIAFAVTFSEPVTGFTTTDVVLSGTAGATTAVVTDGPTHYVVAVSGMTTGGTVIITIPVDAAQDAAGNNSLASTNTDNTVTFINDNTPPVITPNVSGIPGNNGWYTSNVNVTWTVTDAQSTITNKTGCDETNLTTDTAGITYTCTATSAGGTASQSVTVKRDASAPNAPNGVRTPAANGAGWNNTDVTVSFSAAGDIGPSGIASCSGPSTLTTETAGSTISGTCTDMAGNQSAATDVLVKIDKTVPVISGSRSPLANAAGWNNTDVVVSFTCSDEGGVQSGIATNTVAGTTISTEGVEQSATNTGVCVDAAGNAATAASVGDINIDKTKPVVTGQRSPEANSFGWNNTDVTVSFSCADQGTVSSGLATNDVAGATVTTETPGLSVTNTGSCGDNAGNAADASTVSGIKIDKTAPAAPTGSRSPEANAAGWNNQSPVTVSFAAQGDLGSVQSGIDECTASEDVTGETAGTSTVGSCRDRAGNVSADITVVVKIDPTKPVITGQRSPLANSYGWNNTNVTVSFACADEGTIQSGIATNTVAGATVSSEGENQSVTNSGACVDVAGNSATAATVGSINIDKTAPLISGNLDKTPAGTGWFNIATGAPKAVFTCSDPLSGIADGPCPYETAPLGEGAAQSVSRTVTDKAGNSASATVSGINVDLTKPTITITSPSNPSYVLNAVVNAAYSCNGGTSGLGSCSGPVANGSAFNTSSVGPKTFAVSAIDVAGNENSAQVGYNVVYATGACLGSASRQILEPVNADYSSVFKQKSTVPSKFRVCDANGVAIGTPGVVTSFALTAVSLRDEDLPVTELIVSTTPDTAFRWSASDQQWIFNLSTKNLGVGRSYTYTVTLNDGTQFSFGFTLK
jgi:hypothetical protein